MFPRWTALLLSPLITLSTSLSFAGLSLSFENKEPTGEKPSTVRFFLEGKKLRVEKLGGGIMIFDGNQQKLWTIDPKQRSYSEMTEADADRIKGMREKMEQQMKEQMGKMPPEQRAQMEEMLQQMKQEETEPAKKLTFAAMEGTRETAHGFSCKPYRVMEEGKPIEEICFIPWKESGLSIRDFEAFDLLERFLRKIGGSTKNQNRIFTDLSQSPGIPAHVIMTGPGRSMEQELTELKRETFPASRFTLPPGFQKMPTFSGSSGTARGNHANPDSN